MMGLLTKKPQIRAPVPPMNMRMGAHTRLVWPLLQQQQPDDLAIGAVLGSRGPPRSITAFQGCSSTLDDGR